VPAGDGGAVVSRTSAALLGELLRGEQERVAGLNERRRALGLAPVDWLAPASQHVDDDPERSMQEGRVDIP
jgi:hypothetical protein